MIGSDEFDTSEFICSSAVKATLDSGCKLILVLTETDHTVLLIDKHWLQAAILVMSSRLFDSCCARGLMKLSC